MWSIKMFDKILLAVDGSEDAIRAVKRAVELKKKFNSKVVMFHSVEHHMLPSVLKLTVPLQGLYTYEIPPVDYEKIRDEYIKQGEAVLQKAENLFKEENLEVETRLVEEIKPAKYIKEHVEEEDFELVILGCKGKHSKVKQLVLGTVATKVLNDAPCDVLVIR
jgi:nucleotide-binding universal stress UspA family protein